MSPVAETAAGLVSKRGHRRPADLGNHAVGMAPLGRPVPTHDVEIAVIEGLDTTAWRSPAAIPEPLQSSLTVESWAGATAIGISFANPQMTSVQPGDEPIDHTVRQGGVLGLADPLVHHGPLKPGLRREVFVVAPQAAWLDERANLGGDTGRAAAKSVLHTAGTGSQH